MRFESVFFCSGSKWCSSVRMSWGRFFTHFRGKKYKEEREVRIVWKTLLSESESIVREALQIRTFDLW